MRLEGDPLRQIRIAIFLIGLTLAALGAVMVYSSSAVFAYDVHRDAAYYLKRHLLFLFVGIVGAAGVMGVEMNRLRRLAKPMLFLTMLALAAVLIPGIGQDLG
ncbi:MAG: FtsW/RodA/SpoVE family cell cycle protein, partial [Candidatus Omnitrophica bacterium]|nr:FtsW/RodA/SpoVE family cell cycle protein [Candidatus Omnitrophota bacterium]